VAGGLEDFRESHYGRVELEHVLLDDVVLSPGIEDVSLEPGPSRAIIVQASDA
jgi:hypothetical protein